MDFVDALVEDQACVKDQDTAVIDIQTEQDSAMEEVRVSIKDLAVSMQN